MVLRERCVNRMEIEGITIVDSRKTYVFQTTDEFLALIPSSSYSWGGEKHASVCHDPKYPSEVVHSVC